MKRNYQIFLLTLILLLCAGISYAQEYKIGPEDVLEIRFWQDNSLNAQVKVSNDGMITLDVIGQIKATDKTTEQLQNDIVRQMSRLNNKISQAVVRVIEFNYQHVFIKGQITNPGKLAFEEIPDLWTIINEAGGVGEFGDLTRVTIIRGGKDAGKIEVVNVVEAIERGELDKLPKISRQDTIEIPRTSIGLPADDLGDQLLTGKNVIYVLGAVGTPGPIKFEKNLDVLDVLSLAGGTTAEADFKKAKVITKDGYYTQTIHIDLNKYTSNGNIPRYILKDEDTIILPRKSNPFLGLGIGSIAQILGVVTSAVLIYDRLKSDE